MYRILVVDDEPMIRKGLEKLIRQSIPAPADVETAENGEAALERIAERQPDFVFTDIRMPRMDGLALCRSIQEQWNGIGVVVVSGYSDFEYAQKCVSYGVKEYILKPVTRQGVAEAVRKLLTASASAAAAAAPQQIVYIPMAEQEKWLERLEDDVWHLNEGGVAGTLAEMRAFCEARGLAGEQLGEMLRGLLEKVVKMLNRRDVYTFALPADERSAEGAEPFRQLADGLGGLTALIRGKRRGNAKDPVEEVKLYIERNLSKELTLEEVADRLGLNPSYFSQLFKQMTDETFVQYRIKRRMEKAKKLLAIPHYKITDISHEVGYADHPHFTKTFKRTTGYTPSEYRDMLGID